MNALRLEFYKCRRRKIFLVGLALMVAQVCWVGVSIMHMDGEDLRQGWLWLRYQLAMLDSIMLPLVTAVICSRSCEIEHKGSTLKLLETLTTPSRLYNAKLLWGALMLAGLMLLRSALFVGVGYYKNFGGAIPWADYGRFTLVSWGVSMMLYLLQQGLSLRFVNQAVPLIVGLAGSFLGLMALFFPTGVQRLLPWSYYGLLSAVRMEWNGETKVTAFFGTQPSALDIGCFVLWMLLFFVVGRTLFVRREV